MADPVDWTDACARAQALRTAYYELIAGRQAYEITYLANGVSRAVKYSVTNMKLLVMEMREAEDECAAENGVTIRRRQAIVAGSMRTPYNE